MSSVRLRCILTSTAAALAVTLSALPAMGQSTEEGVSAERERLMQRVEELLPLEREARLEADAVRARLDEAARLAAATVVDSITVGGVRILTLPSQVATATEIFTEAWRDYALYGGSDELRNIFVTFQWSAAEFEPIYLAEQDNLAVQHRRWRSRAYVERSAKNAIGAALARDLTGTQMERWASGPVVPPDDLSVTYRELVTLPSMTNRACLGGSPMACWKSLALDTESDDLSTWYNDAERVDLVRRFMSGVRGYDTDPELTPCTVQGIAEACDALVSARSINFRRWAAPLGVEARLAMRWLAVEMGGEGAWERLVEKADAPPAEALEYASGKTAEELASRWQALVLEHRPMTYAGSIPVHWSSLMWLALLCAMAMRSTRWRLG